MSDHWDETFKQMLETKKALEPTCNPKGLNVTIAVHLSTSLWVRGYAMTNETGWGQYKTQFQEIVTLGESVVDDQERFPDTRSRFFTFEPDVVAPFQFVALKCRWPQIRRKPLLLLKDAPRREGMFDARYSSSIHRHVMELGGGRGAVPGGTERRARHFAARG
jgi:hypothetical protein